MSKTGPALPLFKQISLLPLHLTDQFSYGVHLLLAFLGCNERRRLLVALTPQGDTLFQQGQALGGHRLQLPDVVLLPGVVLSFVF